MEAKERMQMNPYAKNLGERDALTVLIETIAAMT